MTETKPFISTLGVGVSSVAKKMDVSVGCVDVAVMVGIGVWVRKPTNGGVGVKVGVGTVGVAEGRSVGVFVSVGTGVELILGANKFNEQDNSIMVQRERA